MAQRDEVDTAFKGIDAAAAAVPVPRPGRRVPADLAYHPKGLPPADALPSLTQMADPECKTNVRAQRSFASVAQLGSWLELITSAAGLDGERCGVTTASYSRWPCSGGSRYRDRAGDQEERALLLKSYRVRRGALYGPWGRVTRRCYN